MLIGYCRTSTVEQVAGLEAQIRDLKSQGCEKLFCEQVSSIHSKRVELERAIEFCREGDTLVVTKLDRLARSVADLNAIVSRLEGKNVGLRIVDMAVDTSTPTGRLLLNLVGSIAQFEREIMLVRQKEGIAKAKAEGKFKGRQPTARRKAAIIHRLRDEGKSPLQIASELGIGKSSVYRIIGTAKPAQGLHVVGAR